MGVPVYYLLKQNTNNDRNPRNIFAWLDISPELLMKDTPVESGHDTILYIQWGFSRAFDDIASVNRILTEYSQVTSTSTIYILALSISDNANKHMKDCVNVNTMTQDNITFIEIHCSYDGLIHNCYANNLTKTVIRSKLRIAEETMDQNQGPTVANTEKTFKWTWKIWLAACFLIGVGVLRYIYVFLQRRYNLSNSIFSVDLFYDFFGSAD